MFNDKLKERLNKYSLISNYISSVMTEVTIGLTNLVNNDKELLTSELENTIRASLNNSRLTLETKNMVIDHLYSELMLIKEELKDDLKVMANLSVKIDSVSDEIENVVKHNDNIITNFKEFRINEKIYFTYRQKLLESSHTVNRLANDSDVILTPYEVVGGLTKTVSTANKIKDVNNIINGITIMASSLFRDMSDVNVMSDMNEHMDIWEIDIENINVPIDISPKLFMDKEDVVNFMTSIIDLSDKDNLVRVNNETIKDVLGLFEKSVLLKKCDLEDFLDDINPGVEKIELRLFELLYNILHVTDKRLYLLSDAIKNSMSISSEVIKKESKY